MTTKQLLKRMDELTSTYNEIVKRREDDQIELYKLQGEYRAIEAIVNKKKEGK